MYMYCNVNRVTAKTVLYFIYIGMIVKITTLRK